MTEIHHDTRFQLALRVPDVEAAEDFYAAALGVAAAKRRPGYANFVLAEPPLKLVLLEEGSEDATEDAGATGRTVLDHLGIEVADADAVAVAARRLSDVGLRAAVRDATTCCYAVQDKVVTHGPGGEMFEVYTVLADDRPDLEGARSAAPNAAPCC